MKKILLLLLCFISFYSFGQVSSYFHGDAKVLYQFLPTGFAAFGQNISHYVMEKDLENIKNCK